MTVNETPSTLLAEAPAPAEGAVAQGLAAASLAGALLAGCGGGSEPSASLATPSTGAPVPATGPSAGSGTAPAPGTVPPPGTAPAPAPEAPPATKTATPTAVEASRFLAQASMGATTAEIARVVKGGYSQWLDEQFAMPASMRRWDWMIAAGYGVPANRLNSAGFDPATWFKLFKSPDTLRQRVTLALSEIIVVGIGGLGGNWRGFSGANYLDLIEANAFGNYRTLLQVLTTTTAMGDFMTLTSSMRENLKTGALPDENYARELLQLFTIGLVRLNIDGTPVLAGGKPIETFGLNDIRGLARVFAGYGYNYEGISSADFVARPDLIGRPLISNADRPETGEKSFLGTTIPAGTDLLASTKMALDAIFAHPNVAPFVTRQLIQRLVTSNPSPAYVARIATVFNNDGNGVKGNLKAVVRALLLDPEARVPSASPTFGKLREPMLRFAAWGRAFDVNSPSKVWDVGNTSDPGTGLGQSPLRAATVFGFFRPTHVPPNSPFGAAGLVAPELQITNEVSVAGYLNFMQKAIAGGHADLTPDYSALTPLADDARALLDELNLVLAGGQLQAATLADLQAAIATMPSGTAVARANRIHAALLLVMAAPEYLVQT